MSGTTVRVSKRSAEILKKIAKQQGKSLQKVLDEAVEEHRRTLILKEANSAYARLKKDPALWDEEKLERDLWAETLTDGREDSY
ncbi:MAG: toxin-antitoxin system protein [Bacillota bacterium]|nr:toxin-antitoxin system protein [Bacillota bacterium]